MNMTSASVALGKALTKRFSGHEAPNDKHQITNKLQTAKFQSPKRLTPGQISRNKSSRFTVSAAGGMHGNGTVWNCRVLSLSLFEIWCLVFGPCLIFGACYLVLRVPTDNFGACHLEFASASHVATCRPSFLCFPSPPCTASAPRAPSRCRRGSGRTPAPGSARAGWR